MAFVLQEIKNLSAKCARSGEGRYEILIDSRNIFLSPLKGLVYEAAVYPRLAPWAAFFRRFAALLLVLISFLFCWEGFVGP